MASNDEEGGKGEKPAKGDKPAKGEKPAKAPKGDKPAKGAKKEKGDAEKGDAAAGDGKPTFVPKARLFEFYKSKVRPALMKQLGYKNALEVPKVTKVVISMGVGEARENPKKLEALERDVAQIAGQKPVSTRAKQSIANFKLREGMKIGCKVTLRRQRMWEFLDRFVAVACPRMRDFRGLSPKSFDGRGNYSVGLTEQIVFPEVTSDKVEFFNGMNICVCTTAQSDNEGRELLRHLGFPFRGLEVAGIKD